MDHSPAQLALLLGAARRRDASAALMDLAISVASAGAAFGGKEAGKAIERIEKDLRKQANHE